MNVRQPTVPRTVKTPPVATTAHAGKDTKSLPQTQLLAQVGLNVVIKPQILKNLGSTLIRSEPKVSDRCLILVHPSSCVIWDAAIYRCSKKQISILQNFVTKESFVLVYNNAMVFFQLKTCVMQSYVSISSFKTLSIMYRYLVSFGQFHKGFMNSKSKSCKTYLVLGLKID